MAKSTYFENLQCWQHAKNLAIDMYLVSTNGNLNKDLALRDQIRKSAVSVASKIAHARERSTASEFIHILGQAKASAAELKTQLVIFREIGYLSEADYLDLNDKTTRISAMIGGLIRSIRKRSKQASQKSNGSS